MSFIHWANGSCSTCGYVPKMGNRRTAESRRNWIAFCRERHEKKHLAEGPVRVRCRTCMDSRLVIDHAQSSIAAMVRVPCPACVEAPTGPPA